MKQIQTKKKFNSIYLKDDATWINLEHKIRTLLILFTTNADVNMIYPVIMMSVL
jgi:hypothetical protein